MPKPSIFVSHTHSDKPLAEAWAQLIRTAFSGEIDVRASSLTDAGPTAGDKWLQWIVDAVRECTLALIIVTPNSINKPWVFWETGALMGANAAADAARPVVPVLYGVELHQLPTPIEKQNTQVVDGRDIRGIRKLLNQLFSQLRNELPAEVNDGWSHLTDALIVYDKAVAQAALDFVSLRTDAAISEWSERIDQLVAGGREDELPHLHQWIDLALGGRDDRGGRVAIDVRIHRRLAEGYKRAKNYGAAVEQYTLARTLGPRDLFILRALGEVLVKAGDPVKHPQFLIQADEVIERIHKLDKDAFTVNAECAGLAGALAKRRENWQGALEAYDRGFQSNSKSYYLGDNVAQMALQLGDRAKAERTYRQLLTALPGVRERNVWERAAALTAALVLHTDDDAAIGDAVAEVLTGASPQERQTIRQAVESMSKVLGIAESRWRLWTTRLGAEA